VGNTWNYRADNSAKSTVWCDLTSPIRKRSSPPAHLHTMVKNGMTNEARKFRSRNDGKRIAILRYEIASMPSTRLNATGYLKHYIREIQFGFKKEQIGILARIGFLLLPSLSIPFTELSLSSLVSSPIIIPSPIGMELFDVCSTMLFASFRTTPRDKANRL